MADDQLRTRLLAYRIWEAEGCPEGQQERHWHLACRLVAAERITDLPQEVPAARPARRSRPAGESASAATPQPAAAVAAAPVESVAAEGTPAPKSSAKRKATGGRKAAPGAARGTTTRRRKRADEAPGDGSASP